jgi:hypothetical protein
MENASKALIIAGAILLSVLIISLGIMVFQNAKNTVGSTNLSKQEIETFNSQWQAYEGTNKTASEVRTMIQAVIANNAAEEKSGTGRKIQVTDNGTAVTTATTPTTNSSLATSLTNSKTYTISLGYDTNGLVVGISFNK